MRSLLHATSTDASSLHNIMHHGRCLSATRSQINAGRSAVNSPVSHTCSRECIARAAQVARLQAVINVDAPSSSSSSSSPASIAAQPHLMPVMQQLQHVHDSGPDMFQHSSGLQPTNSVSYLSNHLAQPASHSSDNDSRSNHTAQQQQQHHLTTNSVSADLRKGCLKLLEQGRCQEADQQLWSAIMKLRSFHKLKAATESLSRSNLMRPAAVAALVVQLGKLVTRQKRQQQQQHLQDVRQQQEASAAEANHQRQMRRQHHKDESRWREQLAQEQAHAAAIQHARQVLLERLQQQTTSPLQKQRIQKLLRGHKQKLKALHHQIQQRQLRLQQHQQQESPATASQLQSAPTQQKSLAEQIQDAMVLQDPAAPQAAAAAASPAAGGANAAAAATAAAQHSSERKPEQQVGQKQLLHYLVTCIRDIDTAEYTTMQLGLLPRWLVRLGVADSELLGRLQDAAMARLATPDQTGELVPMLWGFSKAAAGTAAAQKPRRKQQQQEPQAQAEQQQQVDQQPTAQQQQQQAQQQQRIVSQKQQLAADVQAATPVPDAAFVSAWLEASAANLHTFSFSQLAASIYSLALLGHAPPQHWLDAFFAATYSKMQTANAQALSNVLWAMGTLGISPPGAHVDYVDAAAVDAAAAAASAAAAAGQGAAGAWAAAVSAADGAATDSSSSSSWWGLFQVAAVAVLWEFTGVGIANLLWGAAKLRLQPSPQVAQLLLWQAQRRFTGMDLQLAVSCVWGVAKLQLKPSLHWLHRFGRRVRHLAPSSISPSLAATLLLSFGLLNYCPREWLRRFLKTLHPQLPQFTAREVANTFTAFEHMRYVPNDDWLFDFHMQARLVLPRCGPQELVTIIHALSVLSNNVASYRVEPDLLAAVFARCRAVAASMPVADVANVAQSIVYLRAAPGTALLAALVGSFSAQIERASVRDLVGLLWALGAFWRGSTECAWLRQNPQLVQQLVVRCGQCMGQLEPLQLKRVLAAVTAMGINPGQQWFAAHEAAVVAQLPALYAATLEQVLWCYRGLGYSPHNKQLLQGALAAKQEAQQQQPQQQQQQQHRQQQ